MGTLGRMAAPPDIADAERLVEEGDSAGAQAIAEAGRLRIDGRVIERAHCPVRVGNVLTYPAHGPGNGEVRVVRVEALPVRRGPAPEAQGCYSDLLDPGENVSQQKRND